MSQDNQEMLKCPMCPDEPGSFPAARWSYEMNGENNDVFEDEKALAFLLANETCFILEQCHGSREPGVFKICVNCNDVFAWACSDAEALCMADLGKLYDAVVADPMWGSTIWCCLKRNQKPQPPVERDMKRDGVWDERMEALGKNTLDAETQAFFAHVAGQQRKISK